jgi:uncharacterized phage-associated protein
MKLQKILYYAQGAFLAVKEVPLFNDEIVAWEHGPVVLSVYDIYKEFGDMPILTKYKKQSEFSEIDEKLLTVLYEKYNRYTASELRNMTHNESPWINAFPNGTITQDAVKSFFSENVYPDNFEFRNIPIAEYRLNGDGIPVFSGKP